MTVASMILRAALAAGLAVGSLWPAVVSAQGSGLSQFLPPVPPLTMPSAPVKPGSKGAAKSAGADSVPTGPVNKSILNGQVTMKLVVEPNAVQRVQIVTGRPFAPADQFAALDAARAVQRDIPLACGKLCKPGKMTPPSINKDGFLSFDMAVQGLPYALSTQDIALLLQANPLVRREPAKATEAAPAGKPAQ
jgi:hypothetical protein